MPDSADFSTYARLLRLTPVDLAPDSDAVAERKRRLAARPYQVVRHRTRLKSEVHLILHAHLIPKCPHADLFNTRGRTWLARQPFWRRSAPG